MFSEAYPFEPQLVVTGNNIRKSITGMATVATTVTTVDGNIKD